MQPEDGNPLTDERLAQIEELEWAARSYCLRVYGRSFPEYLAAALGKGTPLDDYAAALVSGGRTLLAEVRRQRRRAAASAPDADDGRTHPELWALLAAEGWAEVRPEAEEIVSLEHDSLTAPMALPGLLLANVRRRSA
jgi:hypothetical protein